MTEKRKLAIEMLENFKMSGGLFTGYTSGFWDCIDEALKALREGSCENDNIDEDHHVVVEDLDDETIDTAILSIIDEISILVDKLKEIIEN